MNDMAGRLADICFLLQHVESVFVFSLGMWALMAWYWVPGRLIGWLAGRWGM